LIPLVPFDIINYKADLFKIRSSEEVCGPGKLEKNKIEIDTT
jgi:hypothetical protein